MQARIDKSTTDKVMMRRSAASRLTLADIREFMEACDEMFLPDESQIFFSTTAYTGEISVEARGEREVT